MGTQEIHNLAELYERYSGPIFCYLLRLSGDPALADELTGETFYRAMADAQSLGHRHSSRNTHHVTRLPSSVARSAETGRHILSLPYVPNHIPLRVGDQQSLAGIQQHHLVAPRVLHD